MTKRVVTFIIAIIFSISLFPINALAAERYEIIKIGDQDQYVEKLQVRLSELGYLPGDATGYFGTVTQQAVINYQKDNGLTVDGKAGPETLRLLMGKDFKLPADRFETDDTPGAYYPGDKGNMISDIQQKLLDLEYYDYSGLTGYYGPVTEEAVAKFQRTNGIKVTGVADQVTASLLFSDKAKYFCLYPGARGSDVTKLQARLEELGFYTYEKTTGYFGTVTADALKEFQAQSKLIIDAKAGKNTRALLYSDEAEKWDGKDRVAQTSSSESTEAPVDKMLVFAKQQIGKKYVFSTEGPSTFDCSGFVYYVLKYMGISTARYSASGFSSVDSWIKISSKDSLQPGDLLFFKSDTSSRISHTGIYLSGDEFINASSSDGKVKISTLTGYYDRNFMMARRIF